MSRDRPCMADLVGLMWQVSRSVNGHACRRNTAPAESVKSFMCPSPYAKEGRELLGTFSRWLFYVRTLRAKAGRDTKCT